MSRAFVKEPDGDEAGDDLPERAASPHPNYITPEGLSGLQARIEALEGERQTIGEDNEDLETQGRRRQLTRDLRFLYQRREQALVVDPALQQRDVIRFGASVMLADADGATHAFTIVGEDETCAPRRRISWVSPLAQALLGRTTGDTVLWERPAGCLELQVLAFNYSEVLR
ncbi:MAG: GreA/GreB family elongation factor [Gammaproteobacteria bacterium]